MRRSNRVAEPQFAAPLSKRGGSRPSRPASLLEVLTVVHAALFVVVASWAFGGMIHWIRTPLALWGTAGAVLTLAGVRLRWREQSRAASLASSSTELSGARWPLLWLLPLGGFSLLVLLSALNPSYQSVGFFERVVLRPVTPPSAWLPSAARPELALRELWLLAGLYLAGFNLALNLRRRWLLRRLLLVMVVNGVALAIFGTVQKLANAPGLYFGLQPSPNPAFFASFVYHNHWGPFALLTMAAAVALVLEFASRRQRPGFWRSPAPTLLCAVMVLAAAIPLSTSRSSTVLLTLLIAGATAEGIRQIVTTARRAGRSPRPPLLLTSLALALGLAGIGWLGAPVIAERLAKTREQLEYRNEVGGLGGRETLYLNTWRMAQDRPWTGWGLESYRTVFVRYNTEGSPNDHLAFHYDQAHSDWLQSLAETGAIGTLLVGLMGLLPLWTIRHQLRAGGAVTRMLLFAVGLIALYAWVEFPFANPAVVLSFWILFFSGIRYATLSDTSRERPPS